MQKVLNSSPGIQGYIPFKGIGQTFKDNKSLSMPSAPEFKTKLKFDPSKLSTVILKRYLFDLLNNTEPEQLLSGDVPPQYTKDPDNMTDYRVLKELGLMSVKEWKSKLENNDNDVEQLYLDDDVMAQDSRYYYEKWKTIQEEVGNHEKQMSFFRLVSEIVINLSNRNYVEIDHDGEQHTLTTAEQQSIQQQKNTVESVSLTTGRLHISSGIPILQPVKYEPRRIEEINSIQNIVSSPVTSSSLPSLVDEIQMETCSNVDVDQKATEDESKEEEDHDWLAGLED